MRTEKGILAGGARWLWAALVVILVAGATDAATAKDRKRIQSGSATESTKAPSGAKGYIGVYMQELTDEVREGLDLDITRGVLVSGVEDDGPAARAGIEEGDVIVTFDGKRVSSPEELRDAVGKVAPGREARVELMRDGAAKTVTLTVAERPERRVIRIETPEGDFGPRHFERAFTWFGGPRLGVQAHEIDDDQLGAYFNAKKGDGVLVLSVEENSVADKAGVQPGDIIREVGEEKIEDVADLRSALHDYEEGDQFDITVLRHGRTQALKATMDDQPGEFAFHAPGAGTFRWHDFNAPRARAERRTMQDDIRRELDDLKRELKELKEALEERDDG
jgi:predicted metalloprotease with PDZ domain